MNWNKIILSICIIFILLDIGWTWNEYYNDPLLGDIVPLVLPDERNAPVYSDPFAIKAIVNKTGHPNIGRYFCSKSLYEYIRKVPLLLQNFVDPVTSLYLSSTIFKFLITLGFLFCFIRLIVYEKWEWKSAIIAATIVLPFIQNNGDLNSIELINGSIVYCFFYSYPFLLLFFLFAFLFRTHLREDITSVPLWQKVLLFGLAVVISFSSALIPAVNIIGGGLYLLVQLYHNRKELLQGKFTSFLHWRVNIVLLLVLLGFYSLYAGSMNPEAVIKPSTSEMYEKLFQGLKEYFIVRPAIPILLIGLTINTTIVKYYKLVIWKGAFLKICLFALLFATIYIFLLPLGGYREYRPLIIRSDVLIPISILLILLLSASTFSILRTLKGKMLWVYAIVSIAFGMYLVDKEYEKGPVNKACEERILYELSEAEGSIIEVEEPCNVMAWISVKDPDWYKNHALMWQYWNIIDKEVLIQFHKADY